MRERESSDQSNAAGDSNLCEACGGSDFRVIIGNLVHKYSHDNLPATWKYSLIRCNYCGMVFVTPQPSSMILETFYREDYCCYTDALDPAQESQSLKYRIARGRFATHRKKSVTANLEMILGVLVEILTGRSVSYTLGIPLQLALDAQIFDLGFGTGSWLLGMRHIGYTNLHGYDISSNGKNVERLMSLGINVSTGDFLRNYYPDDYFDLIRLEHVFEHLLKPKDVLARVHRMLKPGGLLVLNFPSSEAISFLLSPRHYANRDSPRHLFLHTKRSAQKMLISAGFDRISSRTYAVGLDLEATFNNMLKSSKLNVKLRFGSMIASLYKILGHLFKCGENITIMAVK